MRIRKRSFFEIVFPLTVVFFVCIGTSFIDNIGSFYLRWVFIFLLFLFLFINKKILIYITYWWKALLLIYLLWCVSTTLWSQVSLLTFSKSALFAFNIITLLSAGSLWVVRYGFERCLNWLWLILICAFLAAFLGGGSNSVDSYGAFNLYTGLLRNANAFGFLMAIISPLIFLKLYVTRKKKWLFFSWLLALIIDVRFLMISYSRSSIAIFLCVFAFFCLSLPFSKKILIAISSFFCIMIFLMIIPMSYIDFAILNHIAKVNGGASQLSKKYIFQSRKLVWKKSIEQAKKGGIMGGGFAVTIGDNHVTDKGLSSEAYGREKGNSQLAIMEETGIIGLIFYALILISFFSYAIPYYIRQQGTAKIFMGITLGAIVGLLLESVVEGWWDSAAGPEVICFWTLVGVIYGMIHLYRKKQNVYSDRITR